MGDIYAGLTPCMLARSSPGATVSGARGSSGTRCHSGTWGPGPPLPSTPPPAGSGQVGKKSKPPVLVSVSIIPSTGWGRAGRPVSVPQFELAKIGPPLMIREKHDPRTSESGGQFYRGIPPRQGDFPKRNIPKAPRFFIPTPPLAWGLLNMWLDGMAFLQTGFTPGPNFRAR